jgi:hypothetical protein
MDPTWPAKLPITVAELRNNPVALVLVVFVVSVTVTLAIANASAPPACAPEDTLVSRLNIPTDWTAGDAHELGVRARAVAVVGCSTGGKKQNRNG